ncbi:MAG: hypothetical protein H6R01_1374 [Burkholderiaceae bacterium]|nr:hypothetical protein [Burkholderiaceae bacterium]
MKNAVRAILFSLAFLAASPALAAVPENAAEIKAHLEFMGYEVSYFKDHMVAKHPIHPNFLLSQQASGMIATKPFKSNATGKQNRAKLLAISNDLNAGALAARYYIDKENDMVVEAFYPGSYSKQSFTLFIDAFNMMQKQVQADLKLLSEYFE